MTTEKKTNTAALAQFKEIAEKQKADASKFSDFEQEFNKNTAERLEKYGDETFFSEKQSALIERMHKEHVQGIPREPRK